MPVPRRAHAVVRRSTRPRSSSTASAAGEGGDVFKFVEQTEGLDFKGALESLAERYGVAARARRGGPAGRRAPQASASACSSCSSAPPPSTCATCGSRGRPPARATTWPTAGSTRRRCASSASATRRARGTRSWSPRGARASATRELVRRRAWRAAATRATGGIYDRFRRRIMFPLCDARGPRARVRRARDGRRPAAEVPQLDRQRRLPQGRATCSAPTSRACAAAKADRGDRRRGLHRRDRAAPGRPAQHRRADGHGADRRAGGRARAPGAHAFCWRSTPTAPGRRRCCAPRGSRRGASSSCASCRCRRAATRPTSLRSRAPTRCGGWSGESVPFVRFRVERELAHGRPDQRRGQGPGDRRRCGPSSRRSRRARCARSWSRSSPTASTSRRRS